MALDVAGIGVEHREVLLRNKPAAMLEASPKGTVPVLVLANGTVLEESLDIMEWALKQRGPEGWWDAEDRVDAEAFLATFKPALDRYKYASRYNAEAARGDVDTAQRAIAMDALAALCAPLSERAFLRRETPRLLDFATFPFVRQFANTEPEWWSGAATRAMKTWLTSLVQSERFERIMLKYPLWEPKR